MLLAGHAQRIGVIPARNAKQLMNSRLVAFPVGIVAGLGSHKRTLSNVPVMSALAPSAGLNGRLPTPYGRQPGLPFAWQAGRTVIVGQCYKTRGS
jgi:hypothetical protein